MNKQSRHSRLKAFTLMDVLAGMVIMSIVMVMVFGVVNGVNRQSYDFQHMQVELNDYKILNTQLNRDIDAALHMYEIPNGFILETEKSRISYELKAAELIRITDEGTDVIHPNVKGMELDFLTSDSEEKLITGINITSHYKEIELKSYFSKDYGLSDPINFALLNVD